MKRIALSSLVSLFVLSCSVSVPNNLSKKEDFSSLVTKYNFAELEKEYKSFNTKALSNAYVKRMFGKYLFPVNSVHLSRQLEFSRYLKNNGDTSYETSLKSMFSETPALYDTLTGNTDIHEKITNESGTFGSFIQGLSPYTLTPVAANALNITNTSFTANWNTISGATSYEFVLDNGTAVDVGTVTSYTVNSLVAGSVHNYKVRAIKSGIASNYSNIITVNLLSAGIITTFAGSGSTSAVYDNGQAVEATLSAPKGVFVDSSGNIFFVDSANYRIRKVDTSGNITTVAGNGTSGYSGDGGQATSATLYNTQGITGDNNGNLFIGEDGTRVRKINLSTGIISTVAGNGTSGYSGDGGQATSAQLKSPREVFADNNGNLFISDYTNNRIRKVILSTGIISTVAGTGVFNYSGDGGQATLAELKYPAGIAVDISGNIYFGDTYNSRIRKVTTDGNITTIGGNGISGSGGDGGQATSANISTVNSNGLSLDSSGNIFISDAYNRIRKITASTGIVTTVAGSGGADAFSGDGGPATSAKFAAQMGVFVDNTGNIFISDKNNNRIRKVTATNGIITTVAGGLFKNNIPKENISFNAPFSVTGDNSGNIYVSDMSKNLVRKINSSGLTTVFAGNGTAGGGGNGGQATLAQLYTPKDVFADNNGNVFIANYDNSSIRKVDSNGIITTVAGTGSYGHGADNIQATSSSLYGPYGVTADNSGNIFIADTLSHRIRRVDASTGIITKVAGTAGTSGYSGDGGQATSAQINVPTSIRLDIAGNIYFSDSGNNRIRKVTVSTGIITTVAGTGSTTYNGDNIQATSANINSPRGVYVDSSGNIYFSDYNNQRIRRVDASTHIITTVAGTGTSGYSGDGGQATSANIKNPMGIYVDNSGNIYVADSGNNRIRKF